MTFQEFKNEYFILNKELLDEVEPALHHDMMLAAYTKHHDKLRCRDYYEENKEKINLRHKEYREANKEKLQLYKETHKEQIQERQKNYREANKEQINEKNKQRYQENKEKIQQNVECDCGCFIRKGHLSRHLKTAKHTELLKKQEETKQQQQQESTKSELPEINRKKCDSCDVELIENYKKCECRKCEDWGGCKDVNGYYYLACPQCKKDFEITKTDYWERSYRHGMY